MTVPLGAVETGGVNTNGDAWTTASWFLAPPGQTGADGLSGLSGRTQDSVVNAVSVDIQNSPGWNASSNALCNLLNGNPIVGSIADYGTGSHTSQKLFGGLQFFADFLCGTLTRDPNATGTSAATVLSGFSGFMDWFFNNDFFNGLYDLATDTQNLVVDFLSGIMAFIESLCSVATTTTGTTTPQTIIGGITSVFQLILDNPFTAGLMGLVESTGNVVFDVLGGIVKFLDQLCHAVTGTMTGSMTPNSVMGALSAILTAIFENPLISFLLGLFNETNNMLLDVINAITSVIGDFFGLFTGTVSGQQFADDMVDLVNNAVVSIIDWITADTALIETFINATIVWFENLPHLVIQLVEAALGWISQLPTLATTIIQAMLTWITTIPTLITAMINGALELLAAAPQLAGALIQAFVQLLLEAPQIAITLIEAITGGLIDTLFEGITGIPISGGSLSGLLGSVIGLTSTANGASTGLAGLIGNLLNFPNQVIGSIFKVKVDDSKTTAQLLGDLWAGVSPHNTAQGAAGGTGAPGLTGAPVGMTADATTVYYATQVASYQNWQNSAVNDSIVAASGADGAPGVPWVGY